MIKQNAEYERYNMFCKPDWRYRRVLELCDRFPTPGHCSRRDDIYVRQFRNFLLRWRSSDESRRKLMLYENEGLYRAYQLHERMIEEPEPANFLQARLISGQTPEEICEMMPLTPEIIDWYSKLFFDVLERRQYRDWVTKQVITPAIMRSHRQVNFDPEDGIDLPTGVVSRGFLDSTLKLFSYFGGPFIADLMINGMLVGKPCTSQEDVPNWLDSMWSLSAKKRSAMAVQSFDVTKYNVIELFHLHAKLVELENSIDSNEKKQSSYERQLESILRGFPFAIGNDIADQPHTARLVKFDGGASELRDAELVRVSSGEPVDAESWESETLKELPPPRRKNREDTKQPETDVT